MNSNSTWSLAGRVLKKWTIFLLFPLGVSAALASSQQPDSKSLITGKVIDATNGEPLPGVNILIEGTTTGTVTNTEGKYSLEVTTPNAVLVFSYVGYMLQKVAVEGKAIIDVKLVADIRKLEEIVVIGYGTQKKGDITGAISSVNPKALKEVPVTNAPQMLQGELRGCMY